jgi:hypothetical protein
MPTGNPSDAQIQSTIAVKQGNAIQRRYGDGYIFSSGILELAHSNVLSVLFPQYYGTSVLERIGYYEPCYRDYWTWSELDRTRRSAEVTSGGGTDTLVTDVAVSSPSGGYFVIGDTLMTESGVVLEVTATAEASGFQQITVTKSDGTAITADDVADGERVGHLASSFPEYSSAPEGRLYLPNERNNKLNILRRSSYMSGTALTDKSYIGDGSSWCFSQELIDLAEFQADRERALIFHQKTPDTADIAQRGDGIISSLLQGSVQQTFAGTVTESDMQQVMTKLLVSSPADEYMMFAGAKLCTDLTNALREYHLKGAVNYGVFGNVSVVGLTLNAYAFAGKTVYVMHLPLLDDLESLPNTQASSSPSKIDFSNFGMLLNLGTQNGKKLISMKYKELDGLQRKFIYKYQLGMMGDSPDIATTVDGLSTHMLSDIGVEVRALNQHALLYANG